MAKLYFYYSAMNAGKTTTLLQSSFNYHERGMRTILYTAAIDDRYDIGMIKSRIGLESDAKIFDEKTNIFEEIKTESAVEEVDCILVDEAQFLSKAQVFELAKVCDELKIPVLAYGIRTDFQAELFEGSKYLLGLADEMSELKTICVCGRKATMNLRTDAQGHVIKDGAQTEIGGNERYISLCRKHFMEKISKG
jgi:thymidine kinase